MLKAIIVRIKNGEVFNIRGFNTIESAREQLKKEAYTFAKMQSVKICINHTFAKWRYCGSEFEMRLIADKTQILGLRYIDELHSIFQFIKGIF